MQDSPCPCSCALESGRLLHEATSALGELLKGSCLARTHNIARSRISTAADYSVLGCKEPRMACPFDFECGIGSDYYSKFCVLQTFLFC
jgi:hypothetical protein